MEILIYSCALACCLIALCFSKRDWGHFVSQGEMREAENKNKDRLFEERLEVIEQNIENTYRQFLINCGYLKRMLEEGKGR